MLTIRAADVAAAIVSPDGRGEFAVLFREVVGEAIDRLGKLKKELARDCGLRPDLFSHYQSGHRRPRHDTILRIGSGLRLDQFTTNRLLVAAGYAPVEQAVTQSAMESPFPSPPEAPRQPFAIADMMTIDVVQREFPKLVELFTHGYGGRIAIGSEGRPMAGLVTVADLEALSRDDATDEPEERQPEPAAEAEVTPGPDEAILDSSMAAIRRLLRRAGRRVRFARGEMICHQGDTTRTLHLILRGRVATLVTTPDGQEFMLGITGEHELIGESALLAPDGRCNVSLMALERTETRAIHRRDFDRLRQEEPLLTEAILFTVGSRLVQLQTQLQEAFSLPVTTRILRRLCDLGFAYGQGQPGTVIPLSQEQLASMVGGGRAQVNRVLMNLRQQGAVQIGRRRIVILAPALIVAAAYRD